MARETEEGSVTSPVTISTSRPSRLARLLAGRTRHRIARPLASSARTTCAPTKPVPPVTRSTAANYCAGRQSGTGNRKSGEPGRFPIPGFRLTALALTREVPGDQAEHVAGVLG